MMSVASPVFLRALPPKLPPKRFAASQSGTSPAIPSHRAPSSRTVRFASASSTRHVSPHDYNPDTPRQTLFAAPIDADSPHPRQPIESRMESLPQHYYRAQKNAASAPSVVEMAGFSVLPDRHERREWKRHANPSAHPIEASADAAARGRGGFVTAVVDITPCRWRLDENSRLDPVELHIRHLDVESYKMRRLVRLIEKSLPYRCEDASPSARFWRAQPAKGSLYIYRKDNAHLAFHRAVPNVVVLEGTMTLRDVLSTRYLPKDEAEVFVRWVEEEPVRFVKETSPQRNNKDEADEDFHVKDTWSAHGNRRTKDDNKTDVSDRKRGNEIHSRGALHSSFTRTNHGGEAAPRPVAYQSYHMHANSENDSLWFPSKGSHGLYDREDGSEQQEAERQSSASTANGRMVQRMSYLHMPSILYN